MQDITDILSKYGVSISKFSSSEVITPTNIVQDMINLLPDDVFTPDAKFLDPAAKSGRFLYYLKDKLMHSPSLITAFPSKSAREQHILTHQLYGITTSEASLSFVRANMNAPIDAKIVGAFLSNIGGNFVNISLTGSADSRFLRIWVV